MRRGFNITISLAGGLVLCASAPVFGESAKENPYQEIVDRNVFGLKPAPRPEDNLPPEAPPPKITLQGITSMFGKKQVLFKVNMSLKPGEPPKEVSVAMNEGERQGEIEVLEINEPAGTIKFKNHGKEQTLDLVKDGVKPPPPAPPTLPFPTAVPGSGLPAIPQAAPKPAVAAPLSTSAAANVNEQGMSRIPNRQLRVPPLPPPTPATKPATAKP